MAQLPDLAINAQAITKIYKDGKPNSPAKKALDTVDLQVPRGSLFGLLGPNGAGKSTLINIMADLVNKSSGSLSIWGYDIDKRPRQSRAAIGIVPQELTFDPYFSPRQVLELQAGMYGVPPKERRTMELLETVGLADKADAYARSLSGGMKRRLMVAKAMVHTPPILVLDEPTAGVDVELRRMLWEHVKELNNLGVTIVLTTHYLEEAEELCDRIAIINQGQIVACEDKPILLNRIDSKKVVISLQKLPQTLPTALKAFSPEVIQPSASSSGLTQLAFSYRRSDSPISAILSAVASAGLEICDISTEESDLEDIFLQLTSNKAA